MSDIREKLLREGFSLDTKAARFERVEIVARPPLGCRTSKDRDVAAPVTIKIFDPPLPRTEAILVDRDLRMEGIDGGINEAIAALKARRLHWVLSCHDFFERPWPKAAHRRLMLPLHRTFPSGSFRPILTCASNGPWKVGDVKPVPRRWKVIAKDLWR